MKLIKSLCFCLFFVALNSSCQKEGLLVEESIKFPSVSGFAEPSSTDPLLASYRGLLHNINNETTQVVKNIVPNQMNLVGEIISSNNCCAKDRMTFDPVKMQIITCGSSSITVRDTNGNYLRKVELKDKLSIFPEKTNLLSVEYNTVDNQLYGLFAKHLTEPGVHIDGTKYGGADTVYLGIINLDNPSVTKIGSGIHVGRLLYVGSYTSTFNPDNLTMSFALICKDSIQNIEYNLLTASCIDGSSAVTTFDTEIRGLTYSTSRKQYYCLTLFSSFISFKIPSINESTLNNLVYNDKIKLLDDHSIFSMYNYSDGAIFNDQVYTVGELQIDLDIMEPHYFRMESMKNHCRIFSPF